MFMDYDQLVALIGRADCVTYRKIELRDHIKGYAIKTILKEMSGFERIFDETDKLYDKFTELYAHELNKNSGVPYLEYLTEFLCNQDICL